MPENSLKRMVVMSSALCALTLALFNSASASDICGTRDFTLPQCNVTTANAGVDINSCLGHGSMAANTPGVGTGAWTQISGPVTANFWSPASPTSVVQTNVAGTYVFRWTISNGTCSSSDDVQFRYAPTPIEAGPDLGSCGYTINLGANTPVSGTGTWSVINKPAGGIVTFANANSPTTSVTVNMFGAYDFQWMISVPDCNPALDFMRVNFIDGVPPANAGPDKSVCGLNAFMAGSSTGTGGGLWTQVSGPGTALFANAAWRMSEVNVPVPGTYVFRWTTSSQWCTATSDDMQMTFGSPPNAGEDRNVCGLSIVMTGNIPVVGTGTWTMMTGPGNVTFDNANSPTAMATASIAGSYFLLWTIAGPGCSVSDMVRVTFNNAPTVANAGTDKNVCASSVTMNGNMPGTGFGWWSQTSGPVSVIFNDPASPTSTAIVTASGTYTYRWTISTGLCNSFDEVQVTYILPVTASFTYGNTGSYCPWHSAINPPVNAVVTFTNGGVAGAFSASPSGLSITPGTGAINLKQSASGTYTVTNTIVANGACPAVIATATVTINPRIEFTINEVEEDGIRNYYIEQAASDAGWAAEHTYTWWYINVKPRRVNATDDNYPWMTVGMFQPLSFVLDIVTDESLIIDVTENSTGCKTRVELGRDVVDGTF